MLWKIAKILVSLAFNLTLAWNKKYISNCYLRTCKGLLQQRHSHVKGNPPVCYQSNHTIIWAVFVCVFVCFLSPPRSFGRSSPNLVGVCRWTSHLLLGGFFFEKVNGPTGQRVTFTFHYVMYVPASCHTLQKAPFALLALLQSLIRRILLQCISTAYIGGPRNCYWGVLFLKGQRVDGSMGQWVKRLNGWTGHFHFHYIIYDSRRRHVHTTLLQKAHSVFCSLDG